MSEQRRPRRSWLAISVVTVLLLPVMYVASFGPACFLVKHELADDRFVAYAFRPLYDSSLPVRADRVFIKYAIVCSDESTYLDLTAVVMQDVIDAATEKKFRHQPF